MYFYEIHCHTQETSRCGRSSAHDMMAAYKKKGFTGVIVTDHFVNGYSWAAEPESWDEKMDVLSAAIRPPKRPGMKWA